MKLWEKFNPRALKKGAEKSITIETPRLVLREHTLEDAEKLHKMTNAKGFYYYCFDGSREKVDEFLKRAYTERKLGNTEPRRELLLAITIKETGEFIGHVALETVKYVKGIGYEGNFFVDPAYQNKGYAREAGVNIMKYGLEVMGLSGFSVTTHPDNKPSKHVITSEGYKEIDRIMMDTTRGPEPRILFLLTRKEFYAQRKKDKKQVVYKQKMKRKA